MRPRTLSKILAEFRRTYSPFQVDQLSMDLEHYYLGMIRCGQIDMVVDDFGPTAVCEYWLIKEEDIERIKRNELPSTFTDGDICYVANLTFRSELDSKFMHRYFKIVLKTRLPEHNQVFWFNRKRNRYSQIFKVMRNGTSRRDYSRSRR